MLSVIFFIGLFSSCETWEELDPGISTEEIDITLQNELEAIFLASKLRFGDDSTGIAALNQATRRYNRAGLAEYEAASRIRSIVNQASTITLQRVPNQTDLKATPCYRAYTIEVQKYDRDMAECLVDAGEAAIDQGALHAPIACTLDHAINVQRARDSYNICLCDKYPANC